MAKGDVKWKFLANSVKKGKAGLPGWFLAVLANRGVKTDKEIKEYLNPLYENLPGTDMFFNIDKAVERIKQVKEKNEKVAVYGDYDVDGVCSTAIVFEALNKIGVHDVETYIPHRENEGYGLNKKALTQLKKEGINLIIAVDCGINSKEIIDNQTGVDFMVIDHHEIEKGKTPKKAILIHPALTNNKDTYPFSAGAMTFFFARALQAEYPNDFLLGQEKWLLDLTALSTICDVMPLTGYNRVLAHYGLLVLSKTKRIGLLSLMKTTSINPKEISSYEVGFVIGPRLNAAGRLEHAKKALELVLTSDGKVANLLATELNRMNMERQKLCTKILSEAKEEIENGGNKNHAIYLLSNKNWPRGVVGIVASRLSEDYTRPVLVFEDDGEKHHGSARSYGNFDITSALAECQDCLLSYGGHAKAAGLKVSKEHFVAFSEKLLTIAKDKIKIEDLAKEIEIDAEIKFSDISNETMELLSKMEPLGFGNRRPLFLLKNASVVAVGRVGKGKEHLKFKIKEGNSEIGAVAFREEKDVIEGEIYDFVLSLKYNVWNGRKNIEATVVDFSKAGRKFFSKE